MILGLRMLQAEGGSTADPLTLATLGFVVLASFALAELGGALGLPKVTGYILAGITLGPFAGNIMSSAVVGEMRMFNTLALGLIATTAGLELDLRGLRRLAKTLATTVAMKIVLGVIFVGGTLYALEMGFGLLGLGSSEETMALALIFAALSLGTSPAIALAIISESKAKGRLSELILGAAIVKDVVVVVCLAIAVATAKALTGGGSLGADVLIHVGEELGASILAGSILGGLLIAYLRWVKAEMLLFVAAMVLVVAEVSAALHLELLLVFIVAGLIVRNFSKYEHDLLHPLETVSLPVFVVFFTSAGASVDLGATLSVLPMALAVCGARALAYIVAGQLGGKAGGEEPGPRKLAWLGYLPQAGVTLGLIGLASGQLGDTIGPAVATLGMAVVAINLLVGPVTMGLALKRAGEVPSAAPSEDTTQASDEQAAHAPTAISDPRLARLLPPLRSALNGTVEDSIRKVARKRVHALTEATSKTLSTVDKPARARRALTALRTSSNAAGQFDGYALFGELSAHLGELPDAMSVPLEELHRTAQPTDSRTVRWKKRATATFALLGEAGLQPAAPGGGWLASVPLEVVSTSGFLSVGC